ncbi:tyrosine-type recombinase/integrase [Effusibacillus consociatus]|uniref:Tyrosine-type recombinase/integrase n=1 Tax=Effusibacillus consociatus TaxID=1117041 RepID=A0ABV9Q090_9BACL
MQYEIICVSEQSVVRPHGFNRQKFDEAVGMFLTNCRYRNLSPVTIQGYRDYLNGLRKDLEDWGLSIFELTPKDLSHRMVNQMREVGCATNTINGRIRTCQQFFKFLWKDGITETNLAANLRPIRFEKQIIQTFTEEQVKALLNQPDRNTFTGLRDYVIMLIFLETGVRVAEMANMKTSDINWEDQTIRIPTGKGRKFRIVPIQQTCIRELRRYMIERGNQGCDNLWVTVFNKPYTRYGIIDMVRRYRRRAGIKGVAGSCHTFRHTMAKFFLINGGDIFTLQSILGHATLEMTRQYVELFSSDIHYQHAKCSPIENLVANGGSFEESEGE